MRFKSGVPASELAPEEQKMRNPIYRLLAEKWGFDALYNWLFIKVGGMFAERVLWKTIDVGLIDGTVNTTAGAVGLLSRVGRRVQTGLVRNYALIMLFGVVALVLALLSKVVDPVDP